MGGLVPQMPCPRISSAWAVLPSSSSPASIYFLSLLVTLKTSPHRTPHRSVQAALTVVKLQESYSTCGARSFCCKKCNLLNAGLSIVLLTMSNSALTQHCTSSYTPVKFEQEWPACVQGADVILCRKPHMMEQRHQQCL